MQIKKTQEIGKVIGEYTAVSLASWVKRDNHIVNDIREALRWGNTALIETLQIAGVILAVQYAKNIIPTTGRNVLARRLAGDTTYSGEVDYGAIGNGSSPVFTNASTQLVSELYRAQADSQAFDENIAYIDWFIASGDVADGTYTEWGAFIDGTVSANSGQAWSLLATGGWVKSGSMFISAKYTFV
ncbi:TPA: hypothetical protein DEB29_03520 [Candidatus Wolfebacteria bacterium]|nr:hypothetical protein [Candidatus Wolfebacteria bacterium]